MRRILNLLIGAPLIVATGSCELPRFKPNIANLSVGELIERSDVILIGTIQTLRVADQSRTPECLVLVQVGVGVENVLKGDLAGDNIDYFYFGPWCGTTGHAESPHLGSRSVFFLHRQQGRWRTLGEYWCNRIPVLSGRHPDRAVREREIRSAIANVLLTPGEEYSPQELVQALKTDAVFVAMDLVGPDHTEKLLQPLLTHYARELRAAACVAIGESFRRWDCAGRLIPEFRIDNVEALAPTLVGDLLVLSRHAEIDSRTALVLAYADRVASRPQPASPQVPPGLK